MTIVESRKFSGPGGATMWLRLVRVTTPFMRPPQPWRVLVQLPAGGRGGTLSTCELEDQGRAALDRHTEAATARGWRLVPPRLRLLFEIPEADVTAGRDRHEIPRVEDVPAGMGPAGIRAEGDSAEAVLKSDCDPAGAGLPSETPPRRCVVGSRERGDHPALAHLTGRFARAAYPAGLVCPDCGGEDL